MPNLPFLVSTYARNITIFGNERLTPRDGFKGVPESYCTDVKSYVARNYDYDELDRALDKGWISRQELDDIMALKTEADPIIKLANLSF
ncbi:hypothetical protein [Paenibacillus tyrfis]|uniref:hypothetical protein n=1 Tax=Paenibacillus tyrfis TaxID=1501230 RepID=UPI00209C9DCC|nr:hypothetical protein [Paenibacillus tyrfis]MCP1307788.1 hypothetical protein [Paenibacillus tyrfis]